MNILLDSKHKLIGAAVVCAAGTLSVTLAFAGGSSNSLSQSGMHHFERVALGFMDGLSGPTQTGMHCMQKTFGIPVSGSNRLNCTANDIRIANAKSVSPSSCTQGETFDLTATFEIVVTANSRYDAGFFFRVDGGYNARGDGTNATGMCSLSALEPGVGPALNLDGDSCGDLNAGSYEVTFTIPDVVCEDDDDDGLLNLPNCTSWHSNASTTCEITDPFTFDPETKSKCKCDDDFQVDVVVEEPTGAVVKVAEEATVTYSVEVTNTSKTSVKIAKLHDDAYGDLCDQTNAAISTSTCQLCGQILASGQSASCTFDVSYPKVGTAGNLETAVTAELKSMTSSLETSPKDSTKINLNLNVP